MPSFTPISGLPLSSVDAGAAPPADDSEIRAFLGEVWAPDFDEGRVDEVYNRVEDAAAAPDDPETRVFLEEVAADESEGVFEPFLGQLVDEPPPAVAAVGLYIPTFRPRRR